MLTLEWDLNEAKQAWREDFLEEGRDMEKESIARKMIQRGNSIDDIHDLTDLPIDRIKQLIAQLDLWIIYHKTHKTL